MNLNEAAEKAYMTALRRQKNGGSVAINEILKHCAGEVIEAQEARTLLNVDMLDVELYADELADVIICALIAAAADGINIEAAIANKMQRNEQRALMQGDKL